MTLMRQIDVCRHLGISDETWRRWRVRRQVPDPVPGLPGVPRWRAEDIDALVTGQRSRHFSSGLRRVR